MGGLIIFASICVPFLVLSDRDAQMAVFGVALGCAAIGFADDFIKIVKRRSLGLSGRYKLACQVVLALALWWVAAHEVGLEPMIYFRIGDISLDIGPVALFRARLLRHLRRHERRQPDRRPRRPRAGSCAIVLLTYTGDHLHHGRPAEPALFSSAWSAPASASSGSTPSRPRSSWATPAHSAWGARSARSR